MKLPVSEFLCYHFVLLDFSFCLEKNDIFMYINVIIVRLGFLNVYWLIILITLWICHLYLLYVFRIFAVSYWLVGVLYIIRLIIFCHSIVLQKTASFVFLKPKQKKVWWITLTVTQDFQLGRLMWWKVKGSWHFEVVVITTLKSLLEMQINLFRGDGCVS